jgi:endonuclease/exonuclease/phosphatase (EEP) superfamily protein YafD
MFRRLISAVVIVAIAAALVVLVWPQLFGLQRVFGVAQLISLRGLAVVVAGVALVACVLLGMLSSAFRRFGSSLGVLMLVFALANIAILAGRGAGDGAFATKGPADLTVLSWNTLGDATGAQAIAELALETEADVVALPETTAELAGEVAALLSSAGHPMEDFTVAFDQVAKARSTSLLISTELGGYHLDPGSGSTARLPSVVARPDDGTGPAIAAVHAVAPIPGYFDSWGEDLAWAAGLCDSSNVILAGDFNATLDHFAGLGTSELPSLGGCEDAAAASGNGAVGTWPASLPALIGAPIDHVLATPGWTVGGFAVVQDLDGAGSDHRPVLAQLSPRA